MRPNLVLDTSKVSKITFIGYVGVLLCAIITFNYTPETLQVFDWWAVALFFSGYCLLPLLVYCLAKAYGYVNLKCNILSVTFDCPDNISAIKHIRSIMEITMIVFISMLFYGLLVVAIGFPLTGVYIIMGFCFEQLIGYYPFLGRRSSWADNLSLVEAGSNEATSI